MEYVVPVTPVVLDSLLALLRIMSEAAEVSLPLEDQLNHMTGEFAEVGEVVSEVLELGLAEFEFFAIDF